MTLGEKLQSLRQEMGLSQEQLAEQLEVSRQAVGKWESGQSRPDMDKLVALAALFEVSTDYLLREGGETTPPPPRRRWVPAALGAALVVVLGALVWLVIQTALAEDRAALLEAQTQLSETQQERDALAEDRAELLETEARLGQELDETREALAEEQEGEPRTFSQLEAYYYQFAQTYRLDYVPTFDEGDAPTESPAYLNYAFILNLDNWGERKGTMSKEYVGEMALTYFGVPEIAHLPMWKCWDFDGETYTAMPQGFNPLPVYLLQSYETYQKDGVAYHEVVLDRCLNYAEGEIDPAALGLDTLQKLLTMYDREDFTPIYRERFVYRMGRMAMDPVPIFVAHEREYLDPVIPSAE